MALPGGLLPAGGQCDGALDRRFAFVSATGALEIALHDTLRHAADHTQPHPRWVSRVLAQVLATLGDDNIAGGDDFSGVDDRAGDATAPARAALNRVRDLCVADRQYLLLQWRIRHVAPLQWLTAQCGECRAHYDFPLDWRELPVKPAGANFPFASVHTDHGELTVRVPNGWDQEWLADQQSRLAAVTKLEDRDDAVANLHRQLARRLLVDPPATIANAMTPLSADDCRAIEQAVEAVAPELPDHLTGACPECGAAQQITFDMYQGFTPPIDAVLDDVHRLAVNYHWSEAAILQLPRQRRAQYLARLERERRVQGALHR